MNTNKQLRYFSTFSGIGGFENGIQQAYERTFNEMEQWRCGQEEGNMETSMSLPISKSNIGQYPHCIGFSEIDKYASAIYQHHFPEHKNYGDITKINAEELPDFDLLVGGFPCQAFSIAGKRKGFDDTRGTLFFDLARILRAKQPRLFVFENVKGLLSHDNGNTFRTIMSTIAELGYDAQWQVLNSKNHGVPQNRERIYIVGHLRGTRRPEVFPFGKNGSISNGQKRQVSRGVPVMQQGGVKSNNTCRDSKDGEDRPISQINVVGTLDSDGWEKRNESIRRVYGIDGISPTIPTAQGGGVMAKVLIPEATKKGYAEATVGQSINLAVPNSKTRRGRVSDIAQTLDTGMQQHTLTSDLKIRRLTPLECERLQAFPDNWTNVCNTSDSQRYKCCGNAVTVNVVRDIMIKILK